MANKIKEQFLRKLKERNRPEMIAVWTPADTEGRRSRDIVPKEDVSSLLEKTERTKLKENIDTKRQAARSRRQQRQQNVINLVTKDALGYGAVVPQKNLGQMPAASESSQKLINFLGARDVNEQGQPLSFIDTARISKNIEKLSPKQLRIFNNLLNKQERKMLEKGEL